MYTTPGEVLKRDSTYGAISVSQGGIGVRLANAINRSGHNACVGSWELMALVDLNNNIE